MLMMFYHINTRGNLHTKTYMQLRTRDQAKAVIWATTYEQEVKIMSETKRRVIYPLKMYIKLGKNKLTAYNGRQVLELYKSFLKE